MGNNFGPHGKFKPEIVITKNKIPRSSKEWPTQKKKLIVQILE